MNVRCAQLDGVTQHLVHEADDARVLGGTVEVVVRDAFLHDFEARLLVERADGVRADAEMLLHLALDGLAGREDRREREAGHGLEGVEALRGEEAAGGDFHRAVGAAQREQLLLQQNARREKREKLAVRLDVIQRSVGDRIFGRQPAQDVVFGLG